MSAKEWIKGDESAKEFLCRVLTDRPFLLLPLLNRVPLRVGNVIEIFGPSPSAKTEILIQAAINCILPKEWKGAHYGGLEKLVLFIDLDCRFDILRLAQSLRNQIKRPKNVCDEELFEACLKRFSYVRCYDSFEFIATLKTLDYQIQKERELRGTNSHILLIDSIGAFYWVDRSSTSMPVTDNRKTLSFQTVFETVVQEIRKLLLLYPMIVLASKATLTGDRSSTNQFKRKWSSHDGSALDMSSTTKPPAFPYREYMPSVWQSFVTHRILVQPLDDNELTQMEEPNQLIYLLEWLLPSLGIVDKFVVNSDGAYTVS